MEIKLRDLTLSRVWETATFTMKTEIDFEPTVRSPVLCLAQVGSEVWAGTAAGSIWVNQRQLLSSGLPAAFLFVAQALECSCQIVRVEGSSSAVEIAAAGSGRKHEGAVRYSSRMLHPEHTKRILASNSTG